MSDREAPKLNKLPFIVGDVLLVGLAAMLVYFAAKPIDLFHAGLAAACTALGAWMSMHAFLVEYQARVQFAEAGALTSAMEQLGSLEKLAGQIAMATSQWQTVQDHSSQTAKSAREIVDRMETEARAFTEFLGRANDTEKNHLRLEIEKLRRNEGEWLQLVVRLMDNVYALHAAGRRSGQPQLIEQFSLFQNACRDVIRRVGLVPVEPQPDTPFDAAQHVLLEGQTAQPGDRVAEILACGYTFQGQPVRPPLVALRPGTAELETPASEAQPT